MSEFWNVIVWHVTVHHALLKNCKYLIILRLKIASERIASFKTYCSIFLFPLFVFNVICSLIIHVQFSRCRDHLPGCHIILSGSCPAVILLWCHSCFRSYLTVSGSFTSFLLLSLTGSDSMPCHATTIHGHDIFWFCYQVLPRWSHKVIEGEDRLPLGDICL